MGFEQSTIPGHHPRRIKGITTNIVSRQQGWSLNPGTTVAPSHRSASSTGQQRLYFKELHSEY